MDSIVSVVLFLMSSITSLQLWERERMKMGSRCEASKIGRLCRYVACGYFASQTADFDSAAFHMAPGEAVALDPQARVALEQTQVSVKCPDPHCTPQQYR